MTAQLLPDRVEIGRYNPGRAVTLLRGTWLPVERIFSDQLGGLSREQTAQFYAESWLIVHYLFPAPERREALARYLASLHRGVAEPEAFRAAFGADHKGFETELKRYMNGRIAYGSIARPARADVAITVRPLSPAADDLLLPHAALMLGIADPALEARAIAAIRSAASRYPDGPYAQRVLARAEINSGDRAAGVAMVDRLLQATPDDAELLYVRGVAAFYTGRKDAGVRDASYAAARPWFARAVKADPAYYTALYRLAQTAPASATGSDETLGELSKAHELAPLVGDIAIDAASALEARHRYAEAETALLPIATNPHGGNVEHARSLLERIRIEAGDAGAAQRPAT